MAAPLAGLAPSRKRTLCQFWLGGGCERGRFCGFAHGADELGAEVPHSGKVKRTLCQFFEAGACEKGELCGFAHGEAELGQPLADLAEATIKRTICKFHLEGTCEKGVNCTFAHSDAELGTVAGPPVEIKRTLCRFFLEGTCGRGPLCGFAHSEEELGQAAPLYPAGAALGAGLARGEAPAVPLALAAPAQVKRTMCRFFEQGGCSRGSQCGFAHSPEELGQPVPAAAAVAQDAGRSIPSAPAGQPPQRELALGSGATCKFFLQVGGRRRATSPIRARPILVPWGRCMRRPGLAREAHTFSSSATARLRGDVVVRPSGQAGGSKLQGHAHTHFWR
ncbi:unnamed protein product, partial [Prorocentrum cordatum]